MTPLQKNDYTFRFMMPPAAFNIHRIITGAFEKSSKITRLDKIAYRLGGLLE